MRNLIILIVVFMSVSCSKDKLENCLIGTWKKGNDKITITEDKIIIASGASISFTIDKDVLHYTDGRCDVVKCNGNTMSLTPTSCNGLSTAVNSMNGTYTKL